MDPEDYTNDPHETEVGNHWHVMQKSGDMGQRSTEGQSWKLVDAYLSGGAPWGFTLSGGQEYREPLLITKVEEGSRAAAVSLQVGDELVSINDIPLTGYRQEAICLVKGSYKTLSLVVKRRNEPISRPHSWHSTKFNENQSDTAKTQSPPMPVWQTRYDPSSSSTDISTGWEQTNLRRVSDQFSSLGSMDSLEHPYPAGQLSPAKSNNSMEHLASGKRDSAYSSFSTSSGTPDYTISKSNTASTENMLYKINQWDAGGKNNNSRSTHMLIEGVKQDDRVAYFQAPGFGAGCEGAQTEEPAVSRHSSSSRTSFGPVWHVPDKKKTASPSPPPPLPPTRSDSFAATKVHERGLVSAHSDGPDSHVPSKPSVDNRCSHNLFMKNEGDNLNTSSEKSKYNQFLSNKQHSLSSSDVYQGQPCHKRHHSDKSTFYPQPWTTSGAKPQSVGGYYSSMQELSTNGHAQQFSQNHRRNLSTSLSTIATEKIAENSGHNRYYCVTTCQLSQPNPQTEPEHRSNFKGVHMTQTGNVQNSPSPQTVTKVTYHLPQQQASHSKDGKHQVSSVLETTVPNPNSDDRGSQRGHNTHNVESQYSAHPQRQSEQRRSFPLQNRELPPDIRHHSQVSNKISPQVTPMLHSLSVDIAEQGDKTGSSEDSLESKQIKRNDRFATTLRNEIQMRRANLQKSKSAEGETESTTTSTNSYKDHLKEAQARVLKATSFRRRDLEPVLLENSATDAQPNYPSSAVARKDVPLLPTVTESLTSKSGLTAGQVTRIGGRKRFTAEEKVRSFSEPEKIHEVGVKDHYLNENANSPLALQNVFKESENPCFPSQIQSYTDIQGRDCAISTTTDTKIGIRSKENTEKPQDFPYSAHKQSVPDQQRLGTFAEYEAKWNIQRKPPEARASGRYGSADNILDPRPDERPKTPCFHARSRSSPSADMYGQKIPANSEKEHAEPESEPAENLHAAIGFSDRGQSDCKVRTQPVEFEHYSVPPTPSMTGANLNCRPSAASATMSHTHSSASLSLTESDLPQPEDQNNAEAPSGLRSSPSVLEKPPPPENFSNPHSGIFTHCSPNPAPNSAFVPTHFAKGDSEQGKGLVDKGQGAVHHLSTPSLQPASSSVASSYRPSELTSMEGQRSPSPQFSPQRLSDKPPVSLQDEDINRMEHVIDNTNAAVKKVPIRIVHSEGNSDKETSPFLQHSDFVAVEAEGPDVNRFGSLGAAGQSSVFCAFTRQREPDSMPTSQADPAPQSDTYMTTVSDYTNSEQTSSTTGLYKEDQKREELARDIMEKDKSLADILDQSKVKTTMDLMEGIFPQEEQLLEEAHQRRKVPSKQTASRSAEEREKEDNMAGAVPMVTSSTYYSTSAPKAELLNKMKDMPEQEEDSEEELDIDLANKKQELIDSLTKKLQVLREARESLQEDILDNNNLGDEVEARVQQVCKPNELDKFRMFVGDLDKVVSLLLSLSGRLARVENALNSLEEDATQEERRTLIEKRKLLIRQHEDAKELKENLDRRERVVYDILANYLREETLTDYKHFVKMKSALIIEQRKLEDKIKLGEEQLKCLMDSLPIEQRLGF